MAKLAGWFAGTDRTTSNARGQVVRGFAIQAPCPHSTAPPGSWICMGELIVVTVARAVTVRVGLTSGVEVEIGAWVG